MIFLVHPTCCESVVWLSERKDVLSGFLGVLALSLYIRWQDCQLRRTQEGVPVSRRDRAWYGLALGAFLLALLSKSQLVTLPLVLMAIDVFKRRVSWNALVVEKIPFFALSAVFAVVTLAAHAGVAESTNAGISLTRPLGALPHYLVHCLLPIHLLPYYDLQAFSVVEVVLGAGILALLVVASFVSLRRRRVFFVGACWFGFWILPVIGVFPNLILVADRYLYLALVGPAWILADFLVCHVRKGVLRVGLPVLALLLSVMTWGYSET